MQRKNMSAISGCICCFGMILIGISTNGGIATITNFLHLPSMIITFGGALFAVMMTGDSFQEFIDGVRSLGKAFSKPENNIDEIAEQIYELSSVARKEGLLALEERTAAIENKFFCKGIRLTVDGTEPALIKDILETEMLNHLDENAKNVQFWENLGAFAPAWGMIGTLLGLINMMKAMGDDTSAIGSGMSLALITTLYGSIFSNWLCIPVAAKLKKSNAFEELQMSLVIEGVLSIQAGENPAVIKEKIRAFRNDWNEQGALPDAS